MHFKSNRFSWVELNVEHELPQKSPSESNKVPVGGSLTEEIPDVSEEWLELSWEEHRVSGWELWKVTIVELSDHGSLNNIDVAIAVFVGGGEVTLDVGGCIE